MATSNTIHTVGGVNLDKDPRSFQPNELSYANDNEVFGTVGGRDTSSYPLPSSKLAYTIPSLQTQYQYVRAKFDPTATSYALQFRDSAGDLIGPTSINITVAGLPSATVTEFVAAIDTALSSYGHSATFDSEDGLWFSLAIYSGAGTPIFFSMTESETIGGVTSKINIYTLQEYFNPIGAVSAQMKPLQAIQLQNYQIVFSKSYDGQAQEIGYAIEDKNGDWTYTSLIVSRQFNFPEDQVIEIQIEEASNNQFGIYWTAENSGKPKTLYIPIDMSSPLRYNMSQYATQTLGLFTLESLDEQTNTQIQNYARIEFSSQNQSGGNLEAGTWFYFVASGINRNYSEWSPASEPIPVFTETTNGPSAGAVIGGDRTPKVTGKANVLTILGVDAKVYDTVRVAAMLNQGGGYSAVIVGEFDTDNAINGFTITHTGLEATLQAYDTGSLPPVQNVILTSKNLQIKKNRLNYANVTIQGEEDLDGVFDDVVLGQVRAELESTGVLSFESNPLFRAQVSTPYTSSTVGPVTVNFDNASTNGNFNTGSFNLGTDTFTAPSAGDYTITLGSFQFEVGVGTVREIGVTRFYVYNSVSGLEYLGVYDGGRFLDGFAGGSVNVTLALNDTIRVIAYVERKRSGTASYTIVNGTFGVTKIISDYPVRNLKVGEYQLPENVATKTGYMVNETYPYFGRILYDSGYVSQWRYIGTYSFYNGGTLPSTLQDAFLTDTTGTPDAKVYSYGLTIDGINVSGIKDRVRRIEIGRGICNPTILGTGMFIASDSSTGGGGGTFTAGLYTGNTDTANNYGTVNNSTSDNRYFGVMVCPDWATGSVKPQFQDGDYLIVYGSPTEINTSITAGAGAKWGVYRNFFGAFSPLTGSAVSIDIADAAYTEWNTNSRVLKNDTANKFLAASLSNNGEITTLAAECMAITLESRINPISGMFSFAPDYGVYYVQYCRPNANQYTLPDVKVVSCNHFIDISPSSPDTLPQQEVFGGDTYTQKTFMKVLYNAKNPDTTKSGTLTSFIAFYSQNKINQQMRFVDKSFTNKPFPFGTTLNDYFFGVYDGGEQFQIDAGYSWVNPLDVSLPYNSRIPQQTDFKSRIYYSQQKALSQVEDSYRVILPNDFKDLAAKDGEINALLDVNTVMIAIQPFKISVLPYQSDVGLSAADGSLYIGSGGVYAQRENPVSTYGAELKSGILLAQNGAGNSMVYWYSNAANALMRYGSDGVKNLSTENGWRTWFLNNSKLVSSEFDVVLGFDRNRNSIFTTFRAVNTSVALWNSGTTYSEGDYVRYGALNKYKTFENLQDIYVALGTSTGSNPYDNPAAWEYVPITNTDYYNYSTAVFNEKANFFNGNFSLLASRYFYFDGRIIIPRGRAPWGMMFDLFGGDSYLSWLSDGSTAKSGSFVLEWVSTKRGLTPERFKWVGLQVGMNHNTANNPALEVTTETQVTNALATDWAFMNGQLGVGVYPDANDEIIIGDYAKVRLTSSVFYRVYAMAVHLYDKARTILK
jgi:hypothetical protein